jgi:predicted acetyltransferase
MVRVTAHDVRVLQSDEVRAAADLFTQTLHVPPANDELWQHVVGSYETGRLFGARHDGEIIGTASSFGSVLTVPGGGTVPMAAVTRVGVRSDHTRRGVLTAVLREQLADVQARGEPLAGLRATESGIYGRFGFGVASRARSLAVVRRRCAFHATAPRGGQVRMLAGSEAMKVIPPLYERLAVTRPGMITRPDAWWAVARGEVAAPSGIQYAVHSGQHGDDGFVRYKVERHRGFADSCHGILEVTGLYGTESTAIAELWRFVLGVDLVDEVRARARPLDDPLELLLAEVDACQTRVVEDELWLRLVDVPAALAARAYQDVEPVVLEVRDRFLPTNDGVYRIGPDSVERVGTRPGLVMDVGALASLYLGDRMPSTLAATGHIEVREADALLRADRLFASAAVPWCGTLF